MTPRSYRYTLVYANGSTGSGVFNSLSDAATAVRDLLNDPRKADDLNSLRHIFLSDGTSLMEYEQSEIRDLRNWPTGR